MSAATEQGLKWRAPVFVVIVSLAAIFGFILYSADFGGLIGAWLVAPLAVLVLLVLIVRAKSRARWVRFGLLCCFVLVTWPMVSYPESVRSEARWLAGSRQWKEVVLAAPETDFGLKEVQWDGWGMYKQNTDVYLVFSPDDGLRHYSPTELHGLPCRVGHVQRLEKQWYSVTFYENDLWSPACGT